VIFRLILSWIFLPYYRWRDRRRWKHHDLPKETPHLFVQWKGTDICCDMHCVCGEQWHYDGYFAYAFECPACGTQYETPWNLELKPLPAHYNGVIINDELE